MGLKERDTTMEGNKKWASHEVVGKAGRATAIC